MCKMMIELGYHLRKYGQICLESGGANRMNNYVGIAHKAEISKEASRGGIVSA